MIKLGHKPGILVWKLSKRLVFMLGPLVVVIILVTNRTALLLFNGQSMIRYSSRDDTGTAKPIINIYVYPVRNLSVNCRAIIEGDKPELRRAMELNQRYNRRAIPDLGYLELTKNCEEFKKIRGYTLSVGSKEEAKFPIAFSILLYKEAEQAERLLRSIYRPHNCYCLHVDGYSDSTLHKAMLGIANCFHNVFIASKTEKVVYEGFSRLQADINCMRDLIDRCKSWKYLINLASQAFPLKTNLEMVKILQIYNGSNDIEGITDRTLNKRYRLRHILTKEKIGLRRRLLITNTTNQPPPHNLTIVKGSAYGLFSRRFVEFVLQNPVVQDFLRWCQDINSPDEYFWATLHHLRNNNHLRTPGGYTRSPDGKPWLASYSSWGGRDRCYGKFVRGVCVFGIHDLQDLVSRKYLFANKFHQDFQPLALDCMEEWIANKTRSNLPIDLFYYRQLPFVNT